MHPQKHCTVCCCNLCTQRGSSFWSGVAHIQHYSPPHPICVFNDNAKQGSPWCKSLEILWLQLSGSERNHGRRSSTHTHLTGGHFHTACLFSLCNPQYPKQLRSSGCWLHTLDDTLSLSGGTPDGAVNMWGLDTEIALHFLCTTTAWHLIRWIMLWRKQPGFHEAAQSVN